MGMRKPHVLAAFSVGFVVDTGGQAVEVVDMEPLEPLQRRFVRDECAHLGKGKQVAIEVVHESMRFPCEGLVQIPDGAFVPGGQGKKVLAALETLCLFQVLSL